MRFSPSRRTFLTFSALVLIVGISLAGGAQQPPASAAGSRSVAGSVLGSVAAASCKPKAGRAAAATVDATTGSVLVQSPHSKWRKAKRGTVLYTKDRMKTSSKSRASLALCGGGTTYVNRQTVVTVNSPLSAEVKKGEVQESLPGGKNASVKTAQATATGANFDVRSGGSSSTVIGVNSKVEVKNKKGSVVVKANQATVVRTNEAPQKPHAVDAQQATAWTSTVARATPTPTPTATATATETPTVTPTATPPPIPGWKFSGIAWHWTAGSDTGTATFDGTMSGRVCGNPYVNAWDLTITITVTDPNNAFGGTQTQTATVQQLIPQSGATLPSQDGKGFYKWTFTLDPSPQMSLEVNSGSTSITPEDQTVSAVAVPDQTCPH